MGAVKDDFLQFERPLLERGEIVVGLDEVGRGALAGPLTVGAVVLSSLREPPEGDVYKRQTSNNEPWWCATKGRGRTATNQVVGRAW